MDGHDLMIQLLPAGVLHGPHRVGQIEAFHLVHVVAHWLLTPVAVVMAAWGLCLAASLAAWAAWGVFWLLCWPLRWSFRLPVR